MQVWISREKVLLSWSWSGFNRTVKTLDQILFHAVIQWFYRL